MADSDIKPFSKNIRRLYLAFFILLFVVCLPFAILYATGYRLQNGFSLVETGGVYISVAPSGATLSLNGKDVGVSGFLNHTFYIDNLEPGTYAVHVAREGDYPWYKTLTVEPRIVTDAQAFLIPSELVVKKIVVGTSTSGQASTTSVVSKINYNAYVLSFAPTTTKKVSTTTTPVAPVPVDSLGDENIYLEYGAVVLEWTKSTSTIPSSLCSAPSHCEKKVTITHSKEKIIRAHFFAGGVLYESPSGIFLTEIDIRPTPLTIPVYSKPGASYRLIDGKLIIKDGAGYFEISGF